MKTKRRVLFSAALFLFVLLAGIAPALVGRKRTLPPSDLIKHGTLIGTAAKAVYGDLHRSWYDWGTIGQSVSVTRRERPNVSASWDEQLQPLSTSYYVTDVRMSCAVGNQIKRLFVAGIFPNGDAIVERWVFKYPKIGMPGVYVPLDQRPLPTVLRTELFRGSQYGRISAVQPDPDSQFVLFLTYDVPTVYRVDLPGGPPSVVLTQSEALELFSSRQITLRHHVTQGRQYHLYESPRWEADLSLPRHIIILGDGDEDGVFDPPVVITPAQWDSLGYNQTGVWGDPCQ